MIGNHFAIRKEIEYMNLKRIFGVILTVLGIIGLIYAAFEFVNTTGSNRQVKILIVYGLLGAIFFFTGIGLVRSTKDDSRPPVQ
jgi:hypothetical protein